MLIGPSQKFTPPKKLLDSASIPDIIKYLEEFSDAVSTYTSSVVLGTIGILGVVGLSSSGNSARNFAQRIATSEVTTGIWTFSSPEADVSYLLIMSGRTPASTIITQVDRGLTYVLFTVQTGLSGAYIDCILLR